MQRKCAPKTETKTAKMQRCRDLIDRQMMGQLFGAEALAEFMELTGEQLLAARRKPNPKFPSDPRHVWVQWPDGSWSEMSWVKRIQQPNVRTQLKKVLRDEVQKDLDDFRSAIRNPRCANPHNNPRCCGNERLTTDHMGMPFDVIAEEWIVQNEPVEIVSALDGVGNMIADRDKAASWITFHASRSVYQILCISCNASKGAR